MTEKSANSQSHFNVLTKDQYNELLEEVLNAKASKTKTALQYRRIKRFDVVKINGIQKLIAKSSNPEDIRYFLTIDEVFDAIDAVHQAIGHGGRDRILSETAKNYCNITKEMVTLFLSMCEDCQKKRMKKKSRSLISPPVLDNPMNSRCEINLIDMQMQTQCDGDKKFLMVYHDDLTKFIILRALKTKNAEEVAQNLADIFTIFGAPCILHCDDGREFANKVIIELTQIWPGLKLVHGKPRHNQSEDMEDIIAAWLQDNNARKWTEGIRFIQFMKNSELHPEINMSPYKAMFGTEPRIGLRSTSLSNKLMSKLQTEEELEEVIATISINSSSTINEANQANEEEINSEGDLMDIKEEIKQETDARVTAGDGQTVETEISGVKRAADVSLQKRTKRMK